MSDYKVEYSGVDAGSLTAQTMSNQTGQAKSNLSEAKTILDNEAVFMGPAKDNIVQEVSALEADFSTIETQYQTIGNYLKSANETYKKGDGAAATAISQAASTTAGVIKNSVQIPSDIAQCGYTVTCYDKDGWQMADYSGAKTFHHEGIAAGTGQEAVHNKWVNDGARYKNGIAVMNIDGKDHYLIATAPTLGTVGDSVNVNLQNGQTVPCVIADSKSTWDANYTTYGHGQKDGSINVLEFEVAVNDYVDKGNPNTAGWGLEWDSSSGVSSVDNYGSIV